MIHYCGCTGAAVTVTPIVEVSLAVIGVLINSTVTVIVVAAPFSIFDFAISCVTLKYSLLLLVTDADKSADKSALVF